MMQTKTKIHHRRKTARPLTTRGPRSRLTTIRLPYELEDAIKEVSRFRGRPYQTVLKELLVEALGLEKSLVEIKRVSAKDLKAVMKRLKKD